MGRRSCNAANVEALAVGAMHMKSFGRTRIGLTTRFEMGIEDGVARFRGFSVFTMKRLLLAKYGR